MTRYYKRAEVEALVVELALGRKLVEVVAEMGITLTVARHMLTRPMGRTVMKELREMQALQREAATGKRAEGEEAKEEIMAGPSMTEEERQRIMKEEMEAMEREDAEKYAG